MVDKHGLKMTGIKEVAGATKGIEGLRGYHIDIYYNVKTGRVWGVGQIGNSFKRYDDEDIAYVGMVRVSVSMQSIADLVYWNMKEGF